MFKGDRMLDKDWNIKENVLEDGYAERAKAEEIVDFVTDVSDAALGNSSQEVEDVIDDKIKEKSKKRKFRIGRILFHPITGGITLFNGLLIAISCFLFPDAPFEVYVLDAVMIIFGIMSIVFGMGYFKERTRVAKNVYHVVNEREDKKEQRGTGKNMVTLVKDLLVFGVLSIISWLTTFLGDLGIIKSLIAFGFSCVLTLGAYASLMVLIEEIKNRT